MVHQAILISLNCKPRMWWISLSLLLIKRTIIWENRKFVPSGWKVTVEKVMKSVISYTLWSKIGCQCVSSTNNTGIVPSSKMVPVNSDMSYRSQVTLDSWTQQLKLTKLVHITREVSATGVSICNANKDAALEPSI